MSEKTAVFDSHFHIIDDLFPLVPSEGYIPATFNSEHYLEFARSLRKYDIIGGAVVSGSFQLYDQTYLIHSLNLLGPSFAGVTQVPPTISDEELHTLHKSRVRAIRFNMYRGVAHDFEAISSLAHRVYDLLGWHSEFYIDSTNLSNKPLFDLMSGLPRIVVDHLGMSEAGLPELFKLMQGDGEVFVKATGFGRINFNESERDNCMRRILEIDQKKLIVGSDMPSTRAKIPFSEADFDSISGIIDDESVRDDVFCNNARRLYGV